MALEHMCRNCGRTFVRFNTIQNKCPKCLIAKTKPLKRTPLKKRGKEYNRYEEFRREIAVGYLDKKYGHICSIKGCEMTDGLEIDHIKTRGGHADLKYKVVNLRYLCHIHHRLVTDGKLKA